MDDNEDNDSHHDAESFIWLQMHETQAVTDHITLVRDHNNSGDPAVIVSKAVENIDKLIEFVKKQKTNESIALLKEIE